MEKSNIVFSLSHQCEKTLECGEKINKYTFEICPSSPVWQRFWRVWPLISFSPSALPYHDEWQAGRSAGVTLLTVSILFFLFPALKTWWSIALYAPKVSIVWELMVEKKKRRRRRKQLCFRFQLIFHPKGKKPPLYLHGRIIAVKLSRVLLQVGP